jgi:PAXNEB protein
LTHRVPRQILDQAIKSSQLVLLNVSTGLTRLIDAIAECLDTSSREVLPIRICIPLLGSPGWGDLHPKVWLITRPSYNVNTHSKDVLHFVYTLRTILRRCSHACASVGLPPYISADSWGGAGWLNKLSWFFDSSITLAGFSGEKKGISSLLGVANIFQCVEQTLYWRLHSLLITDLSTFIRYRLPRVCCRSATSHRHCGESRQCPEGKII